MWAKYSAAIDTLGPIITTKALILRSYAFRTLCSPEHSDTRWLILLKGELSALISQKVNSKCTCPTIKCDISWITLSKSIFVYSPLMINCISKRTLLQICKCKINAKGITLSL